MLRIRSAMSAAVVCLSYACPLFAQSSAATPSISSASLGLVVGAGWSDRRDQSASPLRFGGLGTDMMLTYAISNGSFTVETSLAGSTRALTSSALTAPATERLLTGDAQVALFGRVGPRAAIRYEFDVGLEVGTSLSLARHSYQDPSHRVANFLLGVTGVGPAVSLRRTMFGGDLRVRASAPVVARIDHSYSVVNDRGSTNNVRWVSLDALRAATGVVSFTSCAGCRVGVTYAYRFSALRYDDAPPVRSLSQSFSVGLVARLNGASR